MQINQPFIDIVMIIIIMQDGAEPMLSADGTHNRSMSLNAACLPLLEGVECRLERQIYMLDVCRFQNTCKHNVTTISTSDMRRDKLSSLFLNKIDLVSVARLEFFNS